MTPGTLWCWGRNTFGQLGHRHQGSWAGAADPGRRQDRLDPGLGRRLHHLRGPRGPGASTAGVSTTAVRSATAARAKAPSPSGSRSQGSFKSVSVGWYHACGDRTDNTLVCWGDNSLGQLGRGNTKQDRKIHKVKGRWRSVTTSGWNTCGVKVSGKLKCWGRNLFGQVGTGKSGDASKPTAVGKDTNWAEVDLSWTHACGRQNNGVVQLLGPQRPRSGRRRRPHLRQHALRRPRRALATLHRGR